MVRTGDTIVYAAGLKAVVDRIRIISRDEFVSEGRYDDNGYDIMLLLNDGTGTFKVCFKNRPLICKKKSGIPQDISKVIDPS